MTDFTYCPRCTTPLEILPMQEDSGIVERLRCPGCGWTHWNNPVPVLAAIVEYQGKVLLARNAAWPSKMYALITGFMEAGETPHEGIAREVKEETNLDVQSLDLVGVYDFQRMNQVIIAFHARCEGEVKLSPELMDWRLYDLPDLKCWPAGTGYALADWLRTRGHEPVFFTAEENAERRKGLDSNKFANVPLDEDTRIKSQRQISIKGIDALHQRWVWEGITGESLVFCAGDVAGATDQQIIEMARDAGLVTLESASTLKRNDSGYVFLNFGFE